MNPGIEAVDGERKVHGIDVIKVMTSKCKAGHCHGTGKKRDIQIVAGGHACYGSN